MRLAHISDLHIVSNTDNLREIFLDFALLAGPPAAAIPILSSIYRDERRRQDFLDRLFYHQDSRELDYRKIAALIAVSAPAVYFIIRQLIRLKRIFYLRQDSENIRSALIEDLKRENIKHLIITGDLTNVASEAEFRIAADFLEKLSSFCDVSIIPGNHDVDIQRLALKPRRSESDKLSRYFKYLQEFIPSKKEPIFPYVKLKTKEVCLIGLDSTVYNPLSNTRGRVSSEQMDRLNDILNSSKVRDRYKFILIHHHLKKAPREKNILFSPLFEALGRAEDFFIDKLENADDVISLARDARVNMIIHGHKHRIYTDKIGPIKIQCAGSTTQVDEKKQLRPSYFIYEYKNGEVRMIKKKIQL